MKKIKTTKKNFILKTFIKIARKLGYEFIDQQKYSLVTIDKLLNNNLSDFNKTNITLPLGKMEISKKNKINSLCVIIRTCSSQLMLSQNKKRIFEEPKIEYIKRTIFSVLKSTEILKKQIPELKIFFKVYDSNSDKDSLLIIKKIFNFFKFDYDIENLDENKFKNKIFKYNFDNQFSNMANIYQSLIFAKENNFDLYYFLEDDYIHDRLALSEMIFTYQKTKNIINKDLFICPADYPYLYLNPEPTILLTGNKFHWRKIDQSLCTFFTSKQFVEKYWNELIKMVENEHDPFEKPLNDIYNKELCISPVPSLVFHCTNINSIYGLSPLIDWKKIWDENNFAI